MKGREYKGKKEDIGIKGRMEKGEERERAGMKGREYWKKKENGRWEKERLR